MYTHKLSKDLCTNGIKFIKGCICRILEIKEKSEKYIIAIEFLGFELKIEVNPTDVLPI